MRKNRTLVNAITSGTQEFINVLYPIVITPHITKALGINGIGEISYITSIVNWLSIISMFGSSVFLFRFISRSKDKRDELCNGISQVFTFKLISTSFALVIYYIGAFIIFHSEIMYHFSIIFSVLIIASIFNFDSVLQGLEEYYKLTYRNFIIKVISFVLILFLVNNNADLLIYSLILVTSQLVLNLWSFFEVNKRYRLKIVRLNNELFYSLLPFFLSNIVIGMYSLFDSILLGIGSDMSNVAFFSRAKMIILIGYSLIISVISVILPKVFHLAENDFKNYKSIINKIYIFILFIGLPAMFGIISISSKIMVLLGGIEFKPAAISLIILAPLTIVLPISSWNHSYRLLPIGLEKISLKVQVFMAIFSLILNLFLINYFGYKGASVTYVLTEILGLTITVSVLKKYDSTKLLNKEIFYFLVSAFVMNICVNFFQKFTTISWMGLILDIVIGSTIYLIIILFLILSKRIPNFIEF